MKLRSILILFVVIYAGAFAFCFNRSLNLNFNGQLISLLPENNNHLSTYNELSRLNTSEGGFEAIITKTNGKNVLDEAKEITDRILSLKLDGEKIFKSAELMNDLHEFKYSALYLMTDRELENAYSEIKNYIEEQKMEANPYYVDFDDGEGSSEVTISPENSVFLNKVANTRKYTINDDSSKINISFYPGFSKSNYNKVDSTYAMLRATSAQIENEYDSINIHWGGTYVDQYHKINGIQFSVTKALVIGILCLVLFMVGYMIYINKGSRYKPLHILADLLLIFFILITGFAISLGIFSFLFEEINVFTGIIFSILFGINLDYILHVYSVGKKDILESTTLKEVVGSYLASTKPIILSCLTTALAIASLIFADFKGFIQFGILFFINVNVNLISTYLFLLFSPSSSRKPDELESTKEASKQGPSFLKTGRLKRISVLTTFLLTVVTGAYFGAASLGFNFDFSNLEPESTSTAYDKLESELNTEDSYHEPSYYITDSIEDSRKLFEKIKDGIGEEYEDIERVESFSARYPINRQAVASKTAKIDSIQNLVQKNEKYLEDVDSETAEYLEIIKNTVPPEMASLPKYITNRFFFKDGTIAPMVVIYPKMSLSHGKTSIQFRKSSGTVQLSPDKKYFAASTSIIASSVLELLIKESTFLFVTPLATIFVLLLFYYRSITKTLIAISPLFLTFMILLAINSLIRFDLNLYNVIVLPIIIGVGADNGIHMVDSFTNNKPAFLAHFKNIKFPILSACSFTTILGFVGLLFINHPGMESIGVLAITGITITLFSTFFNAVLVDTVILKN